jgi:glycosidase
MKRRRIAAAIAAALPLLLGFGARCTTPETPATCTYQVFVRDTPVASRVELVGDFNDWRRPGPLLQLAADGRGKFASIELTPGVQRYALIVDGEWRTDDYVGTSSYYNDREVTRVVIGDCRAPTLSVESVTVVAGRGRVELRGDRLGVVAASDIEVRSRLPTPASVRTLGQGYAVELGPLPRGKTTVSIALRGAPSRAIGESARTEVRDVTLWNPGATQANADPESPWEPRDALVYQVVLDRYRNERGVLAPPADAGARAGGNLRGLRTDVEAGVFADLGVDTLWLSPLNRNPIGKYPGSDGKQYEGYHGYWPASPRELDPLLGTERDLDDLMQSAHQRGMRVLFDVVPNHVHDTHPYVLAHPEWFTGKPGDCNCGQGACSWVNNIDNCWFTPYLPNVNWRSDAAAAAFSADVLYWVDRFGADGVRVDAVPMMPRAATRRIVADLRTVFRHPGNEPWLVGENFTGPGAYQRLAYHLGPFGLNTQFNFPLLWVLRSVFAREAGSLLDLGASIDAGSTAWSSSGATMGLTAGNHDVARLASVIMGEDAGTGWTPAAAELTGRGWAQQALAIGLTYVLPGAPFLYYGDEVGLPGRNDPDARRIMPDLATLRPDARVLRNQLARLGKIRRCSAALRRGTYAQIYADAERFVFRRETSGNFAFVVVTRNPPTSSVSVAMRGIPPGRYVDALAALTLDVDSLATRLSNPSRSLAVYLPEGDPCLNEYP